MNERLAHDHAELGDLLGEVIAALDESDVARSHASLDLFWARLAVHIRAEHLHLFPAVLDALSGSHQDSPSASEALNAIKVLRRDHDFFMRELSQAVARTRSLLTADNRNVAEQQLESVHTSVAAVEARLAKHNRIEEEGIYLWTSSLLSAAEQSALAVRVQRELANMPRRFRAK
jgi:Hemerythrin HHE cation binding domain